MKSLLLRVYVCIQDQNHLCRFYAPHHTKRTRSTSKDRHDTASNLINRAYYYLRVSTRTVPRVMAGAGFSDLEDTSLDAPTDLNNR